MPKLICEVDECIYWKEGNSCMKQVVTLRKAIATITDPEGLEQEEDILLGAICPEATIEDNFDGDTPVAV